jgi:hypothetical protein
MARIAYFADLPNGQTLEWRDRSEPTYVDRAGCQRYREVAAKVSRCIPTREPGAGNVLCGYADGLGWVRVTRKVEMKSFPIRHECDARCMNATGRIMKCECACGGKNHGRGALVCEAA